jgi:hypothetical protein
MYLLTKLEKKFRQRISIVRVNWAEIKEWVIKIKESDFRVRKEWR